jgi:hypothetical protein
VLKGDFTLFKLLAEELAEEESELPTQTTK